MPSPTTARGLLGHFPQGADPPATDQCATTPPVRLLTSLSLRAISTAGTGGRGAGQGERPQETEGGRGEKRQRRREEKERNRVTCVEAETWGRMTAARRRKTVEKVRGRQGHDHEQVSSDGNGGESRTRGDGQEGGGDASKGWSGKSVEDSARSETEEEATTAEGTKGGRETRTATPWGT